MKSPIVLLTDFGLKDHYVGVLKGVILSIHPSAQIADLSHGVEPQNVAHGASLLEIGYSMFPKGSIFVCVVDPGVGTKRKILGVKTQHYYFLGPDNGLLSLALKHEKNVTVRSVENSKYFRTDLPSSTFHGRDIFSPTGAHLAKNPAIFSKLGPLLSSIHLLNLPKVKRSKNEIIGEILYFDHFGNAITNIHRGDAEESFWKKAQIHANDLLVGNLKSTYGSDTKSLLAVINSSSQLELAIPGGSAQKEASLSVGDVIRIIL